MLLFLNHQRSHSSRSASTADGPSLLRYIASGPYTVIASSGSVANFSIERATSARNRPEFLLSRFLSSWFSGRWFSPHLHSCLMRCVLSNCSIAKFLAALRLSPAGFWSLIERPAYLRGADYKCRLLFSDLHSLIR